MVKRVINWLFQKHIRQSNIEFLKFYRKYSSIHLREILDSGKLKSEQEMYTIWEEHKKKRT